MSDERRGDNLGRRATDHVQSEAVTLAAKEAARVVTAAGVVGLTDEVAKLRTAFGNYGAVLEEKLRRRWMTIVALAVLATIVVGGLAFTLYRLDKQSDRAFKVACQQRKILEVAIVDVLRPGLHGPLEPGETLEERARRRAGLARVIAGIESPPCSEVAD